MQDQINFGSRVIIPAPLWQRFPNVRPKICGRALQPSSDVVIVGRIADVKPGLGFYASDHVGVNTVTTRYDDKKADWRSLHLTVTVDETLVGPRQAEAVSVKLPSYSRADAKVVGRGLLALGRVLVPLRNLDGYPDDTVEFEFADGGELLATIADDGSIGLPFVADAKYHEVLLQGSSTLDQLLDRAASPMSVIEVDDPFGCPSE